MADQIPFPRRTVDLLPDIPLRPTGLALRRVIKIYNAINISSLIGLIHQAHTSQLTRNIGRMIQTFESCPVDRVLYTGTDDHLRSLSSASDKFDWLLDGLRRRTIDPKDIVLLDDKSTLGSLRYLTYYPSSKNPLAASEKEPNAFWDICTRAVINDAQREHASFFHITYRNQSGLAAILPEAWDQARRLGPQGVSIPDYMVPLAFPLAQSARVWDGFIEAIMNGDTWTIPGTGATFNPSKFLKPTISASDMYSLLSPGDSAAFRGFRRLKSGVESASCGVVVDYCDHPWVGDAILSSDSTEYLIEVKDGTMTETENTVIINTGWLADSSVERRKALSMFHPLRLWNYACLFSQSGRAGYWIPRSIVQASWWTEDVKTVLDKATLQDFRFTISASSNWFHDTVVGIIERFPDPATPEWMVRDTVQEDVTRFVYYHTNMEADLDEEDNGTDGEDIESTTKNANKGHIGADFPRDRGLSAVERFNVAAHMAGFGMMLEFGVTFQFCRSAFLPRVWSDEDNEVFAAGHTMRVELNSGHLGPNDSLLPLSWMRLSLELIRQAETSAGYFFPQQVLELDKPVVLAINLMGAVDANLRGSTLLIPLECIDRPSIYRHLGSAIGPDEKITSWRDFYKKSPTEHERSTTIDLRDFLYGRFLFEFLVRDGEEYYRAVRDFATAHANRKDPDEPIPVNWYKHRGSVKIDGKWQDLGPLTVTQNYVWSFREVAQECLDTMDVELLRDEWSDDDEDE